MAHSVVGTVGSMCSGETGVTEQVCVRQSVKAAQHNTSVQLGKKDNKTPAHKLSTVLH